jgi:flagellar biosynthesis protein
VADQPLTNKPADRLRAVALSTASSDGTPVVVAKGYGAVAESIVERARAHGLYVHASPDLVKLLMNVDLDERIPPQLYAAVAALLVWLHQLEAAALTKQP